MTTTQTQQYSVVSFSGQMLEQGDSPFPSQAMWEEIQQHLLNNGVQVDHNIMLTINQEAPYKIQVGVFSADETLEETVRKIKQLFQSQGQIQYHLVQS